MPELLQSGVIIPFISDPILEFLFILVIAAGISSLLLIFIFRRIQRYGSFSYTNARISAMKGELFRKEKLDQLLEVRDFQNLVNQLESSHYSKYIESLEDFEAKSLEQSIYNHLEDSYQKITKLAPEEIKNVFQEMERILEVRNLEIILAGKLVNLSREEIEGKLTEKRYLSEETYEKLIEAESIGEAITSLEGTRYWRTLDEAVTKYGEEGEMLPVWFSLEGEYWEDALKSAKESRAEYSEIIQRGIRMKIDVLNMLFILRCKAEGVDAERMKDFIIPVHYELKSQNINRARESEDIKGAIMSFASTPYGGALSDALAESQAKNSIFPLERALEEKLLERLRKISTQHYSSAGPIMAFFHEKEVEAKNLIRIINGKAADIDSEKIGSLLISPR
ncbi:MAG: V-type ATPase subunit [Candidatus Hadarchaeota archaeon]